MRLYITKIILLSTKSFSKLATILPAKLKQRKKNE